MTTKTKKQPTPSLATEYRSGRGRLEVRDSGGGTVTVAGYASVTETPYEVGNFTEIIKRGAFEKTLASRPDVVLLLNHAGLPLARTTAGNLELSEDQRGLHFRASLDASDPDTQAVARRLRSGLLRKCSFAFRCTDDVWSDAYDHREVRQIDLNRGDVSVVNFGASPTTSAELLSARMAQRAAMSGHRRSRPVDMELYRARAYVLKLRGQRR